MKKPHSDSEVFLKMELLCPHEVPRRSTSDAAHPSSEPRASQQTRRPLVLLVSPEAMTGSHSAQPQETPGARREQ